MLQTKKTSVRKSVLRGLAILPLAACSIFMFAFGPQKTPANALLRSDKKIMLVLDPGHGGSDPGCKTGSLLEKDLNLKVALRLKSLAPAYNIEVRLTRSSDQLLTLEDRVAFSNQVHPDYFISIHLDNQAGNENGNGTFDIAINEKNAKSAESTRLAQAIYKHTKLPEWGQNNTLSVKDLYVLRGNESAAALLEIGDIKNRRQMQYLEDDAKLDELCRRILSGVSEAREH